MRNDRSVCCAHEDGTGTDESVQVLTRNNCKMAKEIKENHRKLI